MNKIYFIGIGGIGVSALAKYYLSQNYLVAGSDLCESKTTTELKKRGVLINIGPHKAEHLPEDVDLVIYSNAIQYDNPELQKARQFCRVLSYPQALGEITVPYTTIAVSGTHGKSITAAMSAAILEEAGLDPTIIIGTKTKQFPEGNFKLGTSQYLIIEADEFKEAFLNYWPTIIVLTNLEPDHLDYYQSFKKLKKSFRKYLDHLPRDGKIVFNRDDKDVCQLVKKFPQKDQRPFSFLQSEKETLKELLDNPGEYNLYNALASFSLGRALNIPKDIIISGLRRYRGVERRFEEHEIKFNGKNLTLIDDYGHHPTEVKETLKTIRQKYPDRKIHFIFQPHQYKQVYYFLEEFKKTFRLILEDKIVDKFILTDIYQAPGQEEENCLINSSKIAQKTIGPVKYLPYKDIYNYCRRAPNNSDVLVLMGAGNIYNISRRIREKNLL